jgi:predicted anti-sigma-YlaC factor YlaD
MNEHVQDWLPAYHDGELHWSRQKRVEDHLKGCAACRQDLDQLRKLSALLQAAPGPARQTSAGRFASQVELRLVEPAPRPRWQKALQAGWQLAPLGLLFAWVCSQAVLVFSGLFAGMGGFDELLAGRLSIQGLLLSLPLVFSLGSLYQVVGYLPWLPREIAFIDIIVLQMELAVITAVLLWGWVASFWVYRQRRSNYGN